MPITDDAEEITWYPHHIEPCDDCKKGDHRACKGMITTADNCYYHCSCNCHTTKKIVANRSQNPIPFRDPIAPIPLHAHLKDHSP